MANTLPETDLDKTDHDKQFILAKKGRRLENPGLMPGIKSGMRMLIFTGIGLIGRIRLIGKPGR